MHSANVVAAVIKKENLYLITQRNRNKHLGWQWEFPGGKVEKNENFKEALIREIYEELNIVISVQTKISKEIYRDSKINIIIHYYLCKLIKGELKLSEHESFVWEKKINFNKYDFVAGDKNILSLI